MRSLVGKRLGEDQVAGGQVDFHIFFVEVQIENPVALGGVQGEVLDFIAQVRRGKGESRTKARKENQSRQAAQHIISLNECVKNPAAGVYVARGEKDAR